MKGDISIWGGGGGCSCMDVNFLNFNTFCMACNFVYIYIFFCKIDFEFLQDPY